jgi:uncharacterized membrane protein
MYLAFCFSSTEAVVRHNEIGFYFLVAACIFWIAAAAFTFIFMFPLNTRLARTDPNSSPREALLDFKRWLHVTSSLSDAPFALDRARCPAD